MCLITAYLSVSHHNVLQGILLVQLLPLGNGSHWKPIQGQKFSVRWIGSQLVCDDNAIEKCKKKNVKNL